MTNSQLLFESTWIQLLCCVSKCWPLSCAVNKENQVPASACEGAMAAGQLPRRGLDSTLPPPAFADSGTLPPSAGALGRRASGCLAK